MARLLPLLALAPLCTLVAAPLPPGASAPFGRDGLLSRADLERVTYATRPELDADGKPRDDDEKYDEPDRGEKPAIKGEPNTPLRANRYDLAAYVPGSRFAVGGPMPVYLVLRNNRDATLGLHSSIDLSGFGPRQHGGGIDIGVRERGSGKSVITLLSHATNCGGGSLVDVPPLGFYCVRGDLNRVCGGLKPGDYEVDWRVGRFRSAAVPFAVVTSDTPAARAKERASYLHFYNLTPGSDDARFTWRGAQLESVRGEQMAAALAVGQGGAYVPDIRTIPPADRFVEARLAWKPYRDGDRVAVTLRSATPGAEVRFAALPHLFLQIETPDETRGAWEASREAMKDTQADDRADLVTPLTVEARLPDGWHEHLGTVGRARVSVLVTSERVEFPRGAAARIEKLQEQKAERAGLPRPVYWSGIVRTPTVDISIAPRELPPATSEVPPELR